MSDEQSPIYSPFFGVMGAASAMVFSAMGAAYGTAKSGTGIAAMSVMRPGKNDLVKISIFASMEIRKETINKPFRFLMLIKTRKLHLNFLMD
jgi:hypothetical protein